MSQFCHRQQISRTSFYRLRATAASDGFTAAMTPASRAPTHPARRYDQFTDQAITVTRAQLEREGWDAGPWSIWWRLTQQGVQPVPSRSTIARRLRVLGLVTPAPRKRPRSSWHRFTRSRPNELWQLDGIAWQLPDGSPATIFQVQDDCTRVLPALSAVMGGETGAGARAVLEQGFARYGRPAAVLTDNGDAFNQHRKNKISGTERWLAAQGIRPISGRVGHPQTQGKVERSHQPLEHWLDHHPAATIDELNQALEQFRHLFNTERQHLGHGIGITPAACWQGLAGQIDHPLDHPIDLDDLYGRQPLSLPPHPATPVVGTRRVGSNGQISWNSRYIRLGERHAGQHVGIITDPTSDTVHIFDPDGTEIAVIPWPQPGPRRHVIPATKPPFARPAKPSPKS